jgi:hypothetical protein
MQKYIAECREMNLSYIYDPSQQIVGMTADELKAGIDGALALFVNDYEFALIQKIPHVSPGDHSSGKFMVIIAESEAQPFIPMIRSTIFRLYHLNKLSILPG